jgi:hypothetical protein
MSSDATPGGEVLQTQRRRRLGPPFVAGLLLELIVVFIGVYAAFALAEWESSRDAEKRRHQLQTAVVQEIRDITSNTRRVATMAPPELARFDSLIRAGARPSLAPMIEPVRLETHVWTAMLEAGVLDLFDVKTVYGISQFYNELNAGFEQLAQLRTLSETVLIPNLDRDATEFYNADGDLRAKYEWYRSGQWRLISLARNITRMGDSLVAVLAPDSAH